MTFCAFMPALAGTMLAASIAIARTLTTNSLFILPFVFFISNRSFFWWGR